MLTKFKITQAVLLREGVQVLIATYLETLGILSTAGG